jgi:hypothetical protein
LSRFALSRSARHLLLVPVLSLALGAAIASPAAAAPPQDAPPYGEAYGFLTDGDPTPYVKPAGDGTGRKVR